jgi:hypothetical protein
LPEIDIERVHILSDKVGKYMSRKPERFGTEVEGSNLRAIRSIARS